MRPMVRWEEEETDLVTNFFKDVTNPSKRKVTQTCTSFRYLLMLKLKPFNVAHPNQPLTNNIL